MEEEEEFKVCENCQQKFPAFKIDLHEAYCRRNIRRCQLCSKMVDINEQEAHHNQFHSQKPCNYCEALLNPPQLQAHTISCGRRPIECKYCQNPFPYCDIPRHEESCGARTKLCELCRKYIKIRDEKEHVTKCRGELRRNESQELRGLQQLHMPRERINSNDRIKKEVINPYSPRLLPSKSSHTVVIEREPISQLVDPVPISVRLAMQREREKGKQK